LIQTLIQQTLPLVARIGADPKDSHEVRLQKSLFVLGSFMFIIAGALWGVCYLLFGEPIAGSIPLAYVAVSCLSIIAFHVTRSYGFFLFSQLLLILILPFLLMIALGGFVNSSGVILWSVIAPVGAFLFDEPRRAPRWLAGYLILLVISGFLEAHPLVPTSFSPTLITIFFVLNIGTVSAINIALLAYFIEQKNFLFDLLHAEQAKSENLLLNILPRDIAVRLKQGEETIADYYESVSILFVDLVDFTPLSAANDPKHMAETLGAMFSTFDQLVEKYGVEKIETVGDSYLIAAGLPSPRNDHAKVITQLALEIRSYFERGVFLQGHRLHCRIGINSGPAMAGVIERKKIAYTVWGDTVNTASRMQSHGVSGQIQVSKTTHDLIHEDFICEPRGAIHIKGKGKMEVWLITSAKETQ